jgi:hypothetical protein
LSPRAAFSAALGSYFGPVQRAEIADMPKALRVRGGAGSLVDMTSAGARAGAEDRQDPECVRDGRFVIYRGHVVTSAFDILGRFRSRGPALSILRAHQQTVRF